MLEFRLKALDHFLSRARSRPGARRCWPRSTTTTSTTSSAPPRRRRARGTTSPTTSRTPSTGSASPRRSASSSPASARSTSPRSSTTRCARTSRSRASSSWTWTRACASTRTSSASTSRRSSRPTTTSSPRSTAPSGRAARSSTSRRASTVEMPLQAYFRINTENMGQFERTLIIADEGSYVHYVEGCTAPVWTSDSLHSAVVELIAKPGARIRYTTVQNWSQNVFNLVTKRAVAERDATVEWVDCNLGSKLTMKYPSRLPDGRARPRRGPLDRVRRQGPAPGRGREDHPRGAEHDVEHLRQVDLQGRRALVLPRPARGRQGRARLEVHGRLRRAAARRGLALGHLPDDPHLRGRRPRRPRGHRLQGRRGAALLPDEPRASPRRRPPR